MEPFYGPFRPWGGQLGRVKGVKRGCGALWRRQEDNPGRPAAGSAAVVVLRRVLGAAAQFGEEPVSGRLGLGRDVLHALPEEGGI